MGRDKRQILPVEDVGAIRVPAFGGCAYMIRRWVSFLMCVMIHPFFPFRFLPPPVFAQYSPRRPAGNTVPHPCLRLSIARRPFPPTIPYVRRRCAALRLSLLARRSSCPANGGQPHAPGLSAPFSTLPLPLVHSGIRIPLNGWFPCRRCGCAFSLWRAANGVSGFFCGDGRAFGAHGHRKSAKPFCPDASVWFAFRCTIRPVWPKNVRVRGWRRTVGGRTNSGAPVPAQDVPPDNSAPQRDVRI